MNQYTKVLKKFGLSENEAKVYLESLKEHELSPFQISRLTGIPRTTVYDILMNLALKDLVELDQSDGIQKQQTKVRAKNPSQLRKILQKRRSDSYKVEADIIEILPELKKQFHKEDPNALFNFYPGIEGVIKVWDNIDNDDVKKEELMWTQLMPADVFGSPKLNSNVKASSVRRKNINVLAKELIPLNEWTRHVLTYQYQLDNNYINNRQFRYIESPFFEMFLDLLIKGDYIKIACAEEEEVWGLIIKSPALAKSLRSIFQFMWSISTPITEEMVKSWGKNEILNAQKTKKSK